MAERPKGKKSFTTYMTVPEQAKRIFCTIVHCWGAATAPAALCATTVRTPIAAEIAKKGIFSIQTPGRHGRRRNQSIASSVKGSTTAAGFDATERTNEIHVKNSHPGRFRSR